MTLVTASDGKQYNVTVTLNPATVTPASLTLDPTGQSVALKPAILKDASVASITLDPVSAPVTQPPAPAPTAGLITNYSPAPGGRFNVDGVSYGVQNAGKSYSLTMVDSQTLRFEIRQGENWAGVDSSTCDRSELNSTKTNPPGTPVSLSYQFKVEPNNNGAFANSAWYFIVGQFHNDDNATSKRLGHSVGTSPPVAINMVGGALQVLARYCQPGQDPSNGAGKVVVKTLWTDTKPLAPGVFHDIKVQANFKNDATGSLKVTIDGATVVNYSDPLGYGDGANWEYGIYRNTSPEDCAVQYRAVTLS